jgi:hypothetical protein
VPGAEGAEVLEAVVVAVDDLVAARRVQAARFTAVGALVLALVLVALEDGEAPCFPVGRERDPGCCRTSRSREELAPGKRRR